MKENIPRGCLAVMVGREGEEEQERFVVPVVHLNHPLFLQLLKEAEEYGFDQKGTITIPCRVDEFLNVNKLIHSSSSSSSSRISTGSHAHNNHHHHTHLHLVGCFRSSLTVQDVNPSSC